MDTTLLLGLVLLALSVLVALMLIQRRRSEQLRERFGPEYERMVNETGDKRRAEAELAARQKRVQSLSIRPLSPDERDRFAEQWRQVQARFIDAPSQAVSEAEQLIQ